MNAPVSKDPFAFDDPPRAGSRRWLPWALGALMLALVGGAWYFWKASSPAPSRATVTAAPKAGLPPPPPQGTPPAGTAANPPGVDPARAAGAPPQGSGATGPTSPSGAADGGRTGAGNAGGTGPAGAASPGSAGGTAARYPIERSLAGTGPIDPGTATLDAPAADRAISSALASIPGREQILRFTLPSEVVRRVVLTIDNLPGDSMSMQYRAVNPTSGPLLVERQGRGRFIAADNARRYEDFVKMAEGLDVRRVVGLYKRFYPLFQQEYSSIGYPDRHFNDRVVEAIDDLLATPNPSGPIELIQPRVLHEYADPGLERRSAGQRMMLRMGPDNANRLKVKLREIRNALTNESR